VRERRTVWTGALTVVSDGRRLPTVTLLDSRDACNHPGRCYVPLVVMPTRKGSVNKEAHRQGCRWAFLRLQNGYSNTDKVTTIASQGATARMTSSCSSSDHF